MKKVKLFFNCVSNQIKKKFFKVQEGDINHTGERFKEMTDEVNSIEELKLTDEYMFRYNRTTRWQTI